MNGDSIFVQQVDTLEVVSVIGKKNKKMQAILLQEIEKHVAKDSPEYESLRKIVLDESNNFARAIVRLIFGDIEYTMKT